MFRNSSQFIFFMRVLQLLITACCKNDPSPARKYAMQEYEKKLNQYVDMYYTEGGE